MKIVSNLIKKMVDLAVLPVKKNKELKKYLFNIALKHETADFCENEFFQGFYHIEKAAETAKKYITGDHIIVDVGGAIGNTAKIFSKYFPLTKIWIFEPIHENYKKLKELSEANNDFIVIPKAAGSKIEKTLINKANRITSSSLFDLKADKKSKTFSEILIKKGTEEIDVTTLDTTLPSNITISILKLDVQGYELEVLKGSNNTLKRTLLVTLEMNNHEGYVGAPKYFELDEFLRQNNFVLFDIFPSVKDNGQLKEWDCIYINQLYLK